MTNDFEVPQKGKKLFISGNYDDMSYIGINSPLEHIGFYADGYKDAADVLVDSIKGKGNRIKDARIYPIVFLYRQYLELRLKEIYLRFNDDVVEMKLQHNLLQIWKKAKPIVEKAFPNVEEEDLKKTVEATEDYINQFSERDMNSFVYRYPFQKKKINDQYISYFQEEIRIDVVNLKQRMHELDCILEGVVDQLDYLEEAKAEYENE